MSSNSGSSPDEGVQLNMEVHLVVLNGDMASAVFPLSTEGRLTLGRHRTNQVVLEEEQVSRYHAEIVWEGRQWVIHDHMSVNGTFVDGQKVRTAVLQDGQLIRIGPVQMRFVCGTPVECPAVAVEAAPQPTAAVERLTSSLFDATPFQVDEFNALCRFMADAVDVDDARQIISIALSTVQEVTQADVVGFLGLDDAGELLPKIVLPERARGDYHLSKGLTQRAKSSQQPIWLHAEQQAPELESLAGFEDAICVPLGGEASLLGALHAYQRGRAFREHDVRFCEIVARHLAGSLRLSRLRKQLEEENTRLRLIAPPQPTELVGDSHIMAALREKVRLAARHPSTVLIRGETGVGKELVARALHRLSSRKDSPLVVMNCGAIKRELIEGLLFGYRKGAFTSAVDHKGFIARADGGILFLDEIGELPLECQTQLLRALDGNSFTPVGSESDVTVDVRFIAATNRNLEQAVQSKSLRDDLFFRLNRVVLHVPPLREHAEDIPALARHYLEHKEKETGRQVTLTLAAEERLQEYVWPGNVRQLWGVLDTAMAFLEGDIIDAPDLHFGHASLPPMQIAKNSLPTCSLKELEKLAIREALLVTHGNMTEAAKLLGMARSTLNERVKELGEKDA
jgi:Nif-specific regulatory protein